MYGYWQRQSTADTAVVFVHGVLSDGETCWRNKNGTFWPQLLVDESGITDTGVYVFTYETGLFSGSYSITDAADALYEFMRVDKVLGNKNLIFICHSLGGIVARKMMTRYADELATAVRHIGLFLVASPSMGSAYADWLAPLARLMEHEQAAVLRFVEHNPALRELDWDFKNLRDSNKFVISGRELVEDKFVVFRKFLFKQVVKPFAGSVYFAKPFKVPNSDHFTIAKPASADSIQHRILTGFITDFLNDVTRLEDSANRTLPAEPVRATETKVISPRPSARDVDNLISCLYSRDPLESMSAAEELVSRQTPDIVRKVLGFADSVQTEVTRSAVRLALRNSEAAAQILSARVLAAEEKWHSARSAAYILDPSHHAFCAAQLGSAFKQSSRDEERAICLALGSLGDIDWSFALRERARNDVEHGGGYNFIGYALESFCDTFRSTADDQVSYAAHAFEETVLLSRKPCSAGIDLKIRMNLAFSNSARIDQFIAWTQHTEPELRVTGADALGDLRVRRSIPTLITLLGDAHKNVRDAASLALGAIEREEAVEALMQRAPASGGLAMCLHLLDDIQTFEQTAEKWLAQKNFWRWAVIRAIGLKGLVLFSPRLRELTNSPDELERGYAQLSLARLGDSRDHDRIMTSYNEASQNIVERVLSMLAMLKIEPQVFTKLEPDLRKGLADYSYAFWTPVQNDIVSVLEESEIPAASQLAAAWRPFYRSSIRNRSTRTEDSRRP